MSLDRPSAREALGGVGVLHVDNHLLVVDKPAGLLTQSARAGDDNLVERARAALVAGFDKPGRAFVGLVHRLDRNVSGVVVLARTSKAASRLTRAFAERRVDKVYLAVVDGKAEETATLEHRLAPRRGGRGVEVRADGKVARLRYRRLGLAGGRSALEVTLLTGRKHQIRAQLAAVGLPIVGDPLYGRALRDPRRPALHALSLTLDHPVRKEPVYAVAPVPADLARTLAPFGALLESPRV